MPERSKRTAGLRYGSDMLTALQERFALAYVGQAEGNAAKAAKLAGSKAKTADSRASLARKWLAMASVRTRIEELRADVAKVFIHGRSGRIQQLEAIAVDTAIGVTHRLRALDLLNKMAGDYTAIRATVSANEAEPNAKKEEPELDLDRGLFMLEFGREATGLSDEEVTKALSIARASKDVLAEVRAEATEEWLKRKENGARLQALVSKAAAKLEADHGEGGYGTRVRNDFFAHVKHAQSRVDLRRTSQSKQCGR